MFRTGFKQFLRKRQKLIKIADETKDGWQVVAEYESDALASGLEDEKRLKRAWETASHKCRKKDQANNERGKKARFSGGADNQLFRGKTFIDFVLLCDFSSFGSVCESFHGSCLCDYLRELKG